MTDYYTQFSCMLPIGSVDNIPQALNLRGELAAELHRHEGTSIGFEALHDGDPANAMLCLHDGDGYGEPEHVIRFALLCAEAFHLTGLWGFCWSLTCSKPRPDGFGGGAHLIDLGAGQSIGWTDCAHWLGEQIDQHSASAPTAGETSAHAPPARET